MRVILNPVGSHGDVHPSIGIGRALRERGHQVSLVASAVYRDLAEANGFDFGPVGDEEAFASFLYDPNLWHPSRSLKAIFRPDSIGPLLREAYQRVAERYVPGDTVLVGGSLSLAARLAHEALGVPLATAHLQPFALLSAADPPRFPQMNTSFRFPRWVVRLSYWYADRFVLDPLLGPPLNEFRRELGLPRQRRIWTVWRDSPQLVLGLFPEWYGGIPDPKPQTRLTGFVRYDQGEKELPAPVREFLDAGPPPVVFSFGSAMRQGGPYFAAAAEACRLLNVRGLLLAKGSDQVPATLPPTVMHADYAPFSLVLPRAAAVVHHGGIGTSAQALAAGVPQLIMSLAFDQPDNAHRLERLGVARSLPAPRFTAPAAALLLQELLDSPKVAAACREYSQRVNAEDALPEICRLIEGLKGKDQRPACSPAT
jgi:rhamnosyltransferase subunit B